MSVLFYLFRVNLGTKMSWDLNYERYMHQKEYVFMRTIRKGHPVYWEPMVIGR